MAETVEKFEVQKSVFEKWEKEELAEYISAVLTELISNGVSIGECQLESDYIDWTDEEGLTRRKYGIHKPLPIREQVKLSFEKHDKEFVTEIEYLKHRVSELEKECAKKQNEINQLEESCGRMKARVDTWTNYILPRATVKAKEMIGNHQYAGVKIVAIEDEEKKCSCGKEKEIERLQAKINRRDADIDKTDEILKEVLGIDRKGIARSDEFKNLLEEKVNELKRNDDMFVEEKTGIERLREQLKETENKCAEIAWEYCDSVTKEEYKKIKEKLHRRENEIKQIDEILTEVLDVNRKEASCPAEFENLLREKVNGLKKSNDEKSFVDFIPESPVELASKIINASKEYPENTPMKAILKTYRVFDEPEIRQIAEHLLVYCNANTEVEQ